MVMAVLAMLAHGAMAAATRPASAIVGVASAHAGEHAEGDHADHRIARKAGDRETQSTGLGHIDHEMPDAPPTGSVATCCPSTINVILPVHALTAPAQRLQGRLHPAGPRLLEGLPPQGLSKPPRTTDQG